MKKIIFTLALGILSIGLTASSNTPFNGTSASYPDQCASDMAEWTLSWSVMGGGYVTLYVNGLPYITVWGAGSATYPGEIYSVSGYAAPGYIISLPPMVNILFNTVYITVYCEQIDY